GAAGPRAWRPVPGAVGARAWGGDPIHPERVGGRAVTVPRWGPCLRPADPHHRGTGLSPAAGTVRECRVSRVLMMRYSVGYWVSPRTRRHSYVRRCRPHWRSGWTWPDSGRFRAVSLTPGYGGGILSCCSPRR